MALFYFESVVPALSICFINMYSYTHTLLYKVYIKEKEKKKAFRLLTTIKMNSHLTCLVIGSLYLATSKLFASTLCL